MINRAQILSASEDSIRQVADVLLSGEVAALPTETVYGLAVVIGNDAALRRIFEVKSRPFLDPLIVHVLDLSSLLNLVEVNDHVLYALRQLVDAFCPGPLTFILRKKKSVSDIITAGKNTVAIRIPAHPVFREVLRQTGPLAAPSANPFGYISPTCAAHVQSSIGDKISWILDGGNCEIGVESTILNLIGKNFTILRPGAISATMIEEVLGEKIEPYRSIISVDPSAPGLLKQHYSPHTRLRLFEESIMEIMLNFEGNAQPNIAIVYQSRQKALADINAIKNGKAPQKPELLKKLDNFNELLENSVFWFSENNDLDEIACHLFALLHRLDNMKFEMICCQIPEKEGLGLAIYDRLSRAATKCK